MSAFPKLIGQLLAAILLVRFGVYIRFFSGNDLFALPQVVATWLNWLLTIFWMVTITNAFNLIDSMDGLVVGVTTIIFASFTFISIVSEQVALSIFSAAALGISIGLYFYNAAPAFLFLGDAGSQTLGFFLAAISIVYNPQGFQQIGSWFVPILLLGLPLFDMALVVFSRIYRRKPIFQGDLGHTYHRLRQLGLDKNRAVMFIQIITLLLNFLSVVFLTLPPITANILFLAIVLVGMGLIVFVGRKPPLSRLDIK